MNFVIAKDDFISLIGTIQSIVAAKPAIPVLSNVLIEAEDAIVTVSATDLTVSVRNVDAGARIIESGSIALPARRLFQLIREIPSSQIKVTLGADEQAEITSGSSHFKIQGMKKEEFPEFPDLSSALQILFSAKELKEILHNTAFSCAREDSRYMLNGISVQIADQKAIFIGTDGKRLAKVEKEITIDPSFQGSYIIPLKAVEEMIKILSDQEEEVELSLLSDRASLEVSKTILVTKLLSGQYPDIQKVIPGETKNQIVLHRQELLSLLKQVSLFTSEQNSSVRFIFSNQQLSLVASSKEIGEGTVSMPVDYTGSTWEVAFNPHYFIDILRHSKDETVLFSIEDAHNPGKITDSTNALFVIMPMRLTDIAPADHVSKKPAFA
jgi:DNA polymerase III subunit beta